jgi:Protein of unknown function (DUF2971)
VSSKKIWATEYRFLNDREEFLHAKNLALELVEEEPEFVGSQFPARDTLRNSVNVAFNTGALHGDRHRIMVASFSQAEDQLSQWRGYAGSSTGVSVGLNLQSLRPPAEIDSAVVFAPCIYKMEEKKTLLRAIFADARNYVEPWWSSVIEGAMTRLQGAGFVQPGFGQTILQEHNSELEAVLRKAHTSLVFDLLRVASLLKNESFSEEGEWRLVLPSESILLPSNHPVEFRATRDALVPYVAIPLLRIGQEGEIPCNDLILGPGCHPAAEVGVNLFFQQRLMYLQARHSKIPFRPA